MTIKMYASYGAGGRKYPVYSPARGDISEPISVTVPDTWETCQNAAGQTVITLPDGVQRIDHEIITLPDGRAYYPGVSGARHYVGVSKGWISQDGSNDYITLPEYSAARGIARQTIVKKIKAGNFPAVRFGRVWMIRRDEPWIDCRIKSGKYVGSRNNKKGE